MSHSLDSRVTIAPDVLVRIVGGEAVLLNLKSELYLGLDAVATRMWTALNTSISIQAAFDALQSEFEVEPERLRLDLDEFLDKLLEQGLVEISPGRVAVR